MSFPHRNSPPFFVKLPTHNEGRESPKLTLQELERQNSLTDPTPYLLSSPPRCHSDTGHRSSLISPERRLSNISKERRNSAMSSSHDSTELMKGVLERCIEDYLQTAKKTGKVADLYAQFEKTFVKPAFEKAYQNEKFRKIFTDPSVCAQFVQTELSKANLPLLHTCPGFIHAFLPSYDIDSMDCDKIISGLKNILLPIAPTLYQGLSQLSEHLSQNDFQLGYELFCLKREKSLSSIDPTLIKYLIQEKYPSLQPLVSGQDKEESKRSSPTCFEDSIFQLFEKRHGQMRDNLYCFELIADIAQCTHGSNTKIYTYLTKRFRKNAVDKLLQNPKGDIKQSLLEMAAQYKIIEELFSASKSIFGNLTDLQINEAYFLFDQISQIFKQSESSNTEALLKLTSDQIKQLNQISDTPIGIPLSSEKGGALSSSSNSKNIEKSAIITFFTIGENMAIFQSNNGSPHFEYKYGSPTAKTKGGQARFSWFNQIFSPSRQDAVQETEKWSLYASLMAELVCRNIILNPNRNYVENFQKAVTETIAAIPESKDGSPQILEQLKKDCSRSSPLYFSSKGKVIASKYTDFSSLLSEIKKFAHLQWDKSLSRDTSREELKEGGDLESVDQSEKNLELDPNQERNSEITKLQNKLVLILQVMASQITEISSTTEWIHKEMIAAIGSDRYADLVRLNVMTKHREFCHTGSNHFTIRYHVEISPVNLITSTEPNYAPTTYKKLISEYIIKLENGDWVVENPIWNIKQVIIEESNNIRPSHRRNQLSKDDDFKSFLDTPRASLSGRKKGHVRNNSTGSFFSSSPENQEK